MAIKPEAHAIWPVDQLLIIPLNHQLAAARPRRPRCKQGNSHSLQTPPPPPGRVLSRCCLASVSNIWMAIFSDLPPSFHVPSVKLIAVGTIPSLAKLISLFQVWSSLAIKNKQSWSFRNKSEWLVGWLELAKSIWNVFPSPHHPQSRYLLTRVEPY